MTRTWCLFDNSTWRGRAALARESGLRNALFGGLLQGIAMSPFVGARIVEFRLLSRVEVSHASSFPAF